MKNKLNIEALKTRRQFLKEAARKTVAPVVVAYTIARTTPNLFAREPQ